MTNPTKLPAVDRALFNATIRRQFFDGMKPAAIARHLGASVEYVRMTLGLDPATGHRISSTEGK